MNKARYRLISFQLLLIIIGLAAIELTLRNMGYQPGDMKPNWLNFEPVDSLYTIPEYYTDKDGILIADSLYWAERNIHVNSDGFRSPDFDKLDSTKKKVLFIGDSFTWGMSAKPFNVNCMVDLVRADTKYEVINLGIPATDPPQYDQLAKKYIPRLKPDVVFVMFFMGNDLMLQDRAVIPAEPFYYYTNAGTIMADMDGIHFKTAQAAYNYFVSERYYLHHPKNTAEWIISKSSLLSRFYSIRFRIEEKLNFERTIHDTHITKNYLKDIKLTAAQNNTLLKFVLIPEIKEADKSVADYTKRYSDILQDPVLKNDWLIFPNSKDNYTLYPDAHLNNKGHRYYADQLETFLKKAMSHE